MTAALLRFPGDRLATFTCSFGSADVSAYRVVGTKGEVALDPAFDYSTGLGFRLRVGNRERKQTYGKRDQFAPELAYFAECIVEDREPEPSGREGLADVRVARAIQEAARTGRAVELPPFRKATRPTLAQERSAPPVRKPKEVGAEGPRGD
jgi:predicted dehydrogenase